MKSMSAKVVLFVLAAGILTACATGPANTAAPAPTEQILSSTQAPTDPPPATDTAAPTEVPATQPVAATEAPATEPAVQGGTVSFASDILPIMQSRCVNCHGGNRTEEGLILTSHDGLMAGSDEGAVVIPGDATNSLLVELVAAQKMPKRGPKLTPPQVRIITDWVNQGALNN